MKTKVSILMAFMLVWMLLALPAPVQATPPETMAIEVDMYLTGPDSAAGTFSTSGLFSDGGYVSEAFFMAANTSHGIKTLESAVGTITIHYQVMLTWTGPTTGFADGRFVVVSGTGAYQNLHGVGTTHAELDLATGHLTATYTGSGHFD